MTNTLKPTSKCKRLEAAGWHVGTAAEFFGLSSGDELYVEIKLALAEAVRARRKTLGLTRAQLAQRMRSSQAWVAKLEAGDRAGSIDLLVHALVGLGTTRSQLARVLGARTP